MESELVIEMCLILRLQWNADIVKDFLAVIEHFAPTALFHSQHTPILSLVLLFLILTELLQHEREQYLSSQIGVSSSLFNCFLKYVPWSVGNELLGVWVVDVGHNECLFALPGHLFERA